MLNYWKRDCEIIPDFERLISSPFVLGLRVGIFQKIQSSYERDCFPGITKFESQEGFQHYMHVKDATGKNKATFRLTDVVE